MRKLTDFLTNCPDDYRISWDYYLEFIKPVYLVNGNILRGFKLLVLDNERLFSIKDLIGAEYLRAMVYIVEMDYEFDTDIFSMRKDDEFEALFRAERIKLRKAAKWSFSINDAIFMGSKALALEGPSTKGEPTSKLVNRYINAVKNLGTIEEFRDEYLSVNIDLPEYGVMGEKLFIVNKEDPYIRQMITFHREKSTTNAKSGKAKGLDAVTFYYFAEDLQRKLTHIPMRFVRYVGKELVAEVDFNMEGKIDTDSGSVLKIPLKKCYITRAETDSVVKLFGRSFAYED